MDILDYTPIFTRKKIREEFVQEFDIEQLEKFSLAFIDSIEAKKNKIAEEELKLQENKKFITETLKEFNVRGIDINHISKVIEKKRKTKKQKPRAAKYTWKENGEIKTWAGVGIVPNSFKKELEKNNKNLKDKSTWTDYLI